MQLLKRRSGAIYLTEMGAFIARRISQMDERVVKLWREGQFKEFCNMLPEYADYCYGEGNMHDTVMLLGMLGWDKYDGKVEFITELFPSSGTGQVNAVFPLPA